MVFILCSNVTKQIVSCTIFFFCNFQNSWDEESARGRSFSRSSRRFPSLLFTDLQGGETGVVSNIPTTTFLDVRRPDRPIGGEVGRLSMEQSIVSESLVKLILRSSSSPISSSTLAISSFNRETFSKDRFSNSKPLCTIVFNTCSSDLKSRMW